MNSKLMNLNPFVIVVSDFREMSIGNEVLEHSLKMVFNSDFPVAPFSKWHNILNV